MKFEKAKFNCPAHSGNAQAIRDALKGYGKPMSVYKLFLATGIQTHKIKAALSDMVGRTGAVVSMQGTKGAVYALYKAEAPVQKVDEERPYRYPERITIPNYRWGGTRLTW